MKGIKMRKRYKPADVVVSDYGSIVLLTAITDEAEAWIREHLAEAQGFGDSVAVEPRYVPDILAGLANDGLTARNPNRDGTH